MVFESVLQCHAKKAVEYGVYIGLVIGVCFSNPDSGTMELYLDASRDVITVEGCILYIPTLDTAFNNGRGKPLKPTGDDICAFIEVGIFRVSQKSGIVPLFA